MPLKEAMLPNCWKVWIAAELLALPQLEAAMMLMAHALLHQGAVEGRCRNKAGQMPKRSLAGHRLRTMILSSPEPSTTFAGSAMLNHCVR